MGKTGKMAKNNHRHCQGNTGNFEVLPTHRENTRKLFAQVINSPILVIFLEAGYICQVSFVHVILSQIT